MPASRRFHAFLMKVRLFVTGTSALLAVWLLATFFNEVPVDRYPQFGKGSVPVSAKTAPAVPREKPVATVAAEGIPGSEVE